jgi:CDP-glycerol glycerophosphotransferase
VASPATATSTGDEDLDGVEVTFHLEVVSADGAGRIIGAIPPPEDTDDEDGQETRPGVGAPAETPPERTTAEEPRVRSETLRSPLSDRTAVRYRDPLGAFERTGLAEFATAPTPHGPVRPFVSRRGVVCAQVGGVLEDRSSVKNDRLTVRGGVLRLRASVLADTHEVVSARLVLQGRTTGFRVTDPMPLRLDLDRTEERHGRRVYTGSARHDFAGDIAQGEVADDVVDLFLELQPPGGGEPTKRRVGRSPYLVRAATRGGSVTSGDRTLSIEPYYTFKAKYPSLHLETFDTGTYRYLRSALHRDRLPTRGHSERPVWIVGELPYKAQDNGLHLFRHLRDHHPEIDAYYVIRRDSPERRNLDGYEDHVLDYRSREHVDKVLAAERIIGSHHPDFLYPTRSRRFERRVRARKVFLQHGVTAAKWMVPNYGKQAADFDTSLVCVCSDREKEFFVKDFGYDPREVAVTGFARFDALFAGDVEADAKQLLIMPTWRPWLQDLELFTESEYFERWRDLLASPRLRALEEEHGVEVVLCLHPNMQQYSRHFTSPHVRVVVQGEVDVQRLIKQSGVMVTDYSSVAFDFAFLDKPVIYYQFDPDRFPAPHAEPRTEFPGPVVATHDGLLDAIEKTFSDGARMEAQYWQRAQRFCAHMDTQNCERIVRAVRDLESRGSLGDRAVSSPLPQLAYRRVRRDPRYLPTMRKLYRLFLRLPMDADLIVFESGQGRHFADSPRLVYEELLRRGDTRRKVWIYSGELPVRDDRTVVVPRHSVRFYWYLGRAKYWVNNHTFPHYIHRRPEGQYVQTWHGTPLKRMFHDQAGFVGRDPGYVARVSEAVEQWSVLVSPSPYATACMRTAYRWTGPVVEVGYPRNDLLVDERTDERAAAVRVSLGISPEKRIVLYAPTFRDNLRTAARGRFSADIPLDLAEWNRRFGDDHVLLIRTHVLVSNRAVIPDQARANVIDVSKYPDIQELLLVCDVLVTDYSSSFFDYALLGRPIVFYAYDLEEYRDRLRGFYLPYDEDTLPGRIARDDEELFAALEAARTTAVPDPRVLDFAREYAPHDDGHASARVVDELL